MDPFIESQEWDDFHSTFNTVIREVLTPALDPRYFVRVERRVYVEHPEEPDVEDSLRMGDVAIVADSARVAPAGVAAGPGAAVLTPLPCTLPMPVERRETFLVVRSREQHAVVTVIETLSPSNKRRGGDGWREYLEKREEILSSPAHFVELDLLRGGTRMPFHLKERPARGDYYALVSRAERRPGGEIFVWPLLQKLPAVPIPLMRGDADARLDLQRVFETVFDRAAYERSLNYAAPLKPALPRDAQEWLNAALASTQR
jgi:hypothetical protein